MPTPKVQADADTTTATITEAIMPVTLATSPELGLDDGSQTSEPQIDAATESAPPFAGPVKSPGPAADTEAEAASEARQRPPSEPITVARAQGSLEKLEARLVALGFHPQPTNDAGVKLVLGKDVLFSAGSAEMTPQARQAIAGLTQELAGHPLLRFRVVGHTDNSGPSAYNAALSLLRARAFAAALTEAGVPSEQIASEGRGEVEPLTRMAQDGIPARVMNRRIEIYIQDPSLP